MSRIDSPPTPNAAVESSGGARKEQAPGRSASPSQANRHGREGFFHPYKPNQGKTLRVGSLTAVGALLAWGAYYLYQQLQIFEGDEAWRLLVTAGIPLLFFVGLMTLAWWVLFANRAASDFMIATEGEMKKVSWSGRREVIGATKVVILFTVLLSALLFVVDLLFQMLFTWLGVLKV